MMSVYASLVAFIAAAGLLTIAPGLDTALVLRTAATLGPRRAALVSVVPYVLLLGAIHALLGLIWFGCLIIATRPLARFLERPSVVRNCDRLTGGMFMAFGVGLALQSRRV